MTRRRPDKVLSLQFPEVNAIDLEHRIRTAERLDDHDPLPGPFGDEGGRS